MTTIATTPRDPKTRQLTQEFLDHAHSIGVTKLVFHYIYDEDGGYWLVNEAYGPTCHLESVFEELDDLWFATTCSLGESLTMLTGMYRADVDTAREQATVYLDQPLG